MRPYLLMLSEFRCAHLPQLCGGEIKFPRVNSLLLFGRVIQLKKPDFYNVIYTIRYSGMQGHSDII